MAFALDRRTHLEDELTKIVRRELRDAVQMLAETEGAPANAVHEARKSVKKVRAVVDLLEQAGAKLPRKDRKRLKWAARALSRLRDSAVTIESLDRVRHRYPTQLPEPTYAILHRTLVDARRRQEAHADRDDVITRVAKKLAKTRRAAKSWALPPLGVRDLVRVMGDSYRRSRNAMERARHTGQSATLHEWRKELKTLWYQLRLARPLSTRVAPLVARLKRLGTTLGEDHDLVILGATLRGCRELGAMRAEVRQIERAGARMREPLRRRALGLGGRVHAGTPQAFTRWIRSSTMQGRLPRHPRA